jgi:hypothetical protein
VESVAESIVSSDVQASNVPVYPGDTYLAGAKVLKQYGLGPLPGVAMMTVLVSRSGVCTVSSRYDRASITNESLWAQCLLAGFNEVLDLAGPDAKHATPATFASSDATTPASASNGEVDS